MRAGGQIHASILKSLANACRVGTSSMELEELTRDLCQEHDVLPAFLNYKPQGARYAFPAALCCSVNNEIVHGIPNQNPKIFRAGDLVSLDLGIIYKGLITDAAITIGIGDISKQDQQLLDVCAMALDEGIKAAIPNKPVSNIGAAIESVVRAESSFSIYRGLVGHGVGYEVHEEPNVPNFNTRDRYPLLPIGAVIAIEPMIGAGSAKFEVSTDDWTYVTADGSNSVHFEHTVAITADGPVILTKL